MFKEKKTPVVNNHALTQQPPVQPKKTIAISLEDGNKIKATDTLFHMLENSISDSDNKGYAIMALTKEMHHDTQHKK